MFRKPWQLSKENALQKSMRGAPVADGVPYDAIIVVDDSIRKGEDGHESVVYANRGELRAALLDAEQRGDVHVKPEDASLIDSGRIRKAVIEVLYPGRDRSNDRTRDETLMKSGADAELMIDADGNRVVKSAYKAYMKTPGADLKAAARELDDLIARQNG